MDTNPPALLFGALARADKESLLLRVEDRARAIMSFHSHKDIVPLEIDVWLHAVQGWMEDKCCGCGPETAAQALSLAIEVLNCKPLGPRARQAYVAIMQDFPADLLLASVRHCLARERYHVMPTPGALVEQAVGAQAERQRRLQTLQLAQRRLEMARFHTERLSRHYTPAYHAQLEQERKQRGRAARGPAT